MLTYEKMRIPIYEQACLHLWEILQSKKLVKMKKERQCAAFDYQYLYSFQHKTRMKKKVMELCFIISFPPFKKFSYFLSKIKSIQIF